MAFIESIAAGRSFTQKGEPKIEANQELMALGAANLAGGLLHAYPGGGGTSITAVNRRAGAKTQISGLIISAMVILTVLFLARFVSFMPQATLGALVIVAAAGLINIKEFQSILRVRTLEFIWAIAAFLGVVSLGTLEGILVAVLISIITLIYQASFPPVYALRRKPGTDIFRPVSPEHPDDEAIPGLLIVRTEGRLFFASAPNASDQFWALIHADKPSVIIIEFSGVPDLEYTVLNLLAELDDKLRAEGITLWLAALNPEPLHVIRLSPLGKLFGHERMFFNVHEAVEAYQSQE
jgi:MFS superfamily sulfate permease-like transporter